MRTIVCHGDCLTGGSDLEKNYTWPHLVKNKIKVTVINYIRHGLPSPVSKYCPDCRSALTPVHEKMVKLMIGKV